MSDKYGTFESTRDGVSCLTLSFSLFIFIFLFNFSVTFNILICNFSNIGERARLLAEGKLEMGLWLQGVTVPSPSQVSTLLGDAAFRLP